jgi:PAS domain S-box-containing protein
LKGGKVIATSAKLRKIHTNKLVAGLIALAVMLSLVIAALTAYEIYRQRHAVLSDAEQYLTSLVLSMAEQTENAFAAADTVADTIIMSVPTKLESESGEIIHKRLKDLVAGIQVVENFGVFDSQGNAIAYSRVFPTPPTNISERDYFKTLSEKNGPNVVITTPVLSRITNKPVIPYARRLNGPDGSFRGVVVVAVNPEFFRDSFKVALIRPGSAFAIFHSDSTLLVRHPHLPNLIGKSFPNLKLFDELRNKSSANLYYVSNTIDSVSRVISYHHLKNYPLIITASLNEGDLLAEWQRNALRLGGGAAASILLLAVLMVVIIRQLRRQEEQTKALEASESHYRTLYNDTPVMLHSIDANKKITNVSDYWLGKMGYSREEVLSRRSVDFMTPESREMALSMRLPEFFVNGKIDGFPIQMVTKAGELIDILLSAVAQYDEQGKFKQSLSVLIDVTERNRLDAQLRKTLEELERSNADLEQFAYVASHDLQEPLRMVSTYVQLLARRYKGQLDADADDFIGFAAEGAQRMSRMISELLEYSRIHSEVNPFDLVDLNKIFQTALDNLRASIVSKEARVETGPLPIVRGERSQLTSLLLNLIGNGLKYSREGIAPHISISAERDGEFWRISVTDNGIGIEGEYLEKIFRLFQRLHARGVYEGTGIGLTVCKRIIEHHGGRIWAESEPGKGSCFIFTIPTDSKTE